MRHQQSASSPPFYDTYLCEILNAGIAVGTAVEQDLGTYELVLQRMTYAYSASSCLLEAIHYSISFLTSG
jgi:hypothetical protein